MEDDKRKPVKWKFKNQVVTKNFVWNMQTPHDIENSNKMKNKQYMFVNNSKPNQKKYSKSNVIGSAEQNVTGISTSTFQPSVGHEKYTFYRFTHGFQNTPNTLQQTLRNSVPTEPFYNITSQAKQMNEPQKIREEHSVNCLSTSLARFALSSLGKNQTGFVFLDLFLLGIGKIYRRQKLEDIWKMLEI